MMLIFCFHEKPKCSHQNPNLPVVPQCNGASGGSIVRRVCASNHAHKLLQHHVITQGTNKNTLQHWTFECVIIIIAFLVRAVLVAFASATRKTKKLPAVTVWHGAHVSSIRHHRIRIIHFLQLSSDGESWSQRKVFVNSSIVLVQWRSWRWSFTRQKEYNRRLIVPIESI